jgi:hypothetical protein
MKNLISLFILIFITASCSNDESRENTVIETPNVVGTWKPVRYEYKGKVYILDECEKKGQININDNFSGVYERYGIASSGTDCNLYDSFSGNWGYDNINKTLTLTYTENGIVKTLKKIVESFSNTELKIVDSSKDLDNIPGNDEAALIFIRQ